MRDAELSRDRSAIELLWLEYLTWGNGELEARHGFRFPVRETVDADLADIAKFEPPDGRILLAVARDAAVGLVCLRRIGPATAELKRMYVLPDHRGAGLGRALLRAAIGAARDAGVARVVLDSPAFMTAAHRLYRSNGFVDIEPYPESEIPDERKKHWVFMELTLA